MSEITATRHIPRQAVFVALLLALSISPLLTWAAPTAQVSLIHGFSSERSSGRYPQAALCLGSDGLLYGATPVGGQVNQGTAFRLAPDGKNFETLHQFTKLIGDGGAPVGALVEVGDAFFGQSEAGGDAMIGTIYRISRKDGAFSLVRGFQAIGQVQGYGGTQFDGRSPTSGLIRGANGLLYGTTDLGGTFNQGTILAISPDGAHYYQLHSLRGPFAEGSKPQASLVQTEQGFLFGTTAGGGQHNRGTIFRLKLDGSDFHTVHNFQGGHLDGQTPLASLIQDKTGTLFGVTRAGGTTAQGGAIFKINPDGTGYQMLRGFTGLRGEPGGLGNGLLLVNDQWLIGTSLRGGQHAKGTIFIVSKDGKDLTVLHHFAGPPNDGVIPLSPLIEVSGLSFYGTTERGGREDRGTIYRVLLKLD